MRANTLGSVGEAIPQVEQAPVDLQTRRLILAARSGERRALAALWDGCVDTLWSIALAVEAEEVAAMGALASLRDVVAAHAPGLDPKRGWTEQVVERLYLLLSDGLRPLDEVLAEAGPARAGWGPKVGKALEEMPKELRAVFVFHLVGGMGMAEIAGLLGEEEMSVRRARTWVSYRLVSARGGER